MKLKVNRSELATALTAAGGVVAVRTPKPILLCVRLDAFADHLLVSCTDLEVGLRYSVAQVEVDTPGEVLVRADTLTKIVRESTDEVLSIESDDRMVHIRGADSHFQMIPAELEDFPAVPEMEGEPHFTVAFDPFRRLCEWTMFACARESTRYAINGVLFEVADELLMVATDGRRLSKATGKITRADSTALPQVIVPTKALALLKGLPLGPDDTVGIQIQQNRMTVGTGQAMVTSSLVEGHFPNYQDVIPQDCDKEAELETAVFLSGLRRAALLTNEESKGVRLAFETDRLVLSSRAPEQGEAEVSLPIRYSHEPLEIGFNPHFLIEALKNTRAEHVTFRCSTPQRPGLMSGEEGFVHVIMPVSLA